MNDSARQFLVELVHSVDVDSEALLHVVPLLLTSFRASYFLPSFCDALGQERVGLHSGLRV